MNELDKLCKAAIDRIVAARGNKLFIIVSGGGVGITRLLTIPGASQAIEQIIIPYSKNSWKLWYHSVGKDEPKFVSREFVERVSNFLGNNIVDNHLICSAALGTSRERKGENKACVMRNGEYHELMLPKEEFSDSFEEQLRIRQEQDEAVTKWLLGLI